MRVSGLYPPELPGTALFLNGDNIRKDDTMGEFELYSGLYVEAIDLNRGLLLSGETARNARRITSAHECSRSRESRAIAAKTRDQGASSGMGTPRERSRSRPGTSYRR
eukprot:6423531-Heterocapsa_arctica.AAC.1